MYRWQPSAALPLSARAVAASEPDVLVTHLAIPRAGDYDRIGRPAVHDGLERFHASRHGQAQCMPHVLSHKARPERRAVGVTRLGPNGIFMYFDLALSSHCGSFTLQAGAPACYGLRRTSSWCDMMDVCGSKQVADMLLERTLCVFDKRAWQYIGDC